MQEAATDRNQNRVRFWSCAGPFGNPFQCFGGGPFSDRRSNSHGGGAKNKCQTGTWRSWKNFSGWRFKTRSVRLVEADTCYLVWPYQKFHDIRLHLKLLTFYLVMLHRKSTYTTLTRTESRGGNLNTCFPDNGTSVEQCDKPYNDKLKTFT